MTGLSFQCDFILSLISKEQKYILNLTCSPAIFIAKKKKWIICRAKRQHAINIH